MSDAKLVSSSCLQQKVEEDMGQKLFDSLLSSWLFQKNDPIPSVNFHDYYIQLKTRKEIKSRVLCVLNRKSIE